MDGMHTRLFQHLVANKLYDQLTNATGVLHPKRPTLVVSEYDGSDARLFNRGDQIDLLLPYERSCVMESAIARAIETGEIFDDADDIDRHADYIQKTVLPMDAMSHANCMEPKKMKIVITGVIGRVGDNGRAEITVDDMNNGVSFVKDLMNHHQHDSIEGLCDHHFGMHHHDHDHCCDDMEYDHTSLPLDIRRDIHELLAEIDSIDDVSDLDEEELTFDDIEPLKFDDDHDDSDDDDDDDKYDDEDSDDDDDDDDEDNDDDDDDEYSMESVNIPIQPKRLKPMGREIISYIPNEITQIQDTHDQMVLAGYVSSKLERVDFYLNCIDTDDPRYIVPHDRQYLLTMQSQLTDLLQRILKIRPVIKYDRIWKPSIGGGAR